MKNFVRSWVLVGLSIAANYVIMAFASPNFYATMGFDTTLKTVVTLGKILLGIIIFGFIIPKASKK